MENWKDWGVCGMSWDESKYEGLQVYEVERSASGGITIRWDAPRIGFGELYIFWGEDGKLHIDTESMSDAFVSRVLALLPPFMVVEG